MEDFIKKIIKNSLGYDSDLYVYQDKNMFNYSVDTILLGNFATINRSTNYVLEVGTNNGALAIFLSARKSTMLIDAIEIQKDALEIAQKNLDLNNKNNQINLIHDDFNHFYKSKLQLKKSKKYDAIICNPPFYKVNASVRPKRAENVYIATHEIKLTLEQLIKGASKIIKQKGYLAIVEPTERLVDLFVLLRQYGFEPKRVQMIHARENTKSNLVLVEARFKVGWGTHFLKNIYLHPNDSKNHQYQDDVKKLYKPIKFNSAKGDQDE